MEFEIIAPKTISLNDITLADRIHPERGPDTNGHAMPIYIRERAFRPVFMQY